MRIFITGGAGYVGSMLTPKLLQLGHEVTVYDLMIYGNNVLDLNPNLKTIKGDIRDIKKLENSIKNHDAFIHLACISNDPSFELNPNLGKSINYDCFEPMVKACKEHGIKRFIYASSSSVYGVKDEDEVTENMSLKPLTDYSKYKAMCEDILINYKSNDFIVTTIRPATVCGYSRRQRLDVIINILTNHAINTGSIKIFGGNQKRPNIDMTDMVRAYIKVIDSESSNINGQIFNVGDENHSVKKLGELVRQNVGDFVKVENIASNDDRSYHINSNKIKKLLGFKLESNINNAIKDVKNAITKDLLVNTMNNSLYYNIKRMQEVDLK
jgi:nucleoside-diphosphate-sugar epimerase